MVTNFFGTIGSFLLLTVTILDVESSVTSFRVYNERRILDRLAAAPLVSLSLSRRAGPISSTPPESSFILHQNSESFEPRREREPSGEKKRRIRKVIRKVKQTTTTEESTPVTPHPYDISPLNNYNNRDIEIYDRVRTRRKYGNRFPVNKDADLQRAESGNPFINSSAPISSDFAGDNDNGLQFQIQILHPLLNSDSVLSHKDPKLPEDKTVPILHHLSEEVAGDIPIIPDLKKLRRKQPLLNHDSIISGEIQVSKTDPPTHSNRNRNTGKISSKIRQKPEGGNRVVIVEPFNGRPLSTSYPPITSQTIPDTATRIVPVTRGRPLTTTTTTTARPTIRLTSRPKTKSTTNTVTTTTERPSTVILSPVQFSSTTGNPEAGTGVSPQVIIFPPEEEDDHPTTYHTPRAETTTPMSTEQDILNQLLGFGQSTSHAPANQNQEITGTNNFFDLFNLFQPTTPITEPTTSTTQKPPVTQQKTQAPVTRAPRPRTTEVPNSPPTPAPTQSQADLDNLLQLALLEGLLQSGTEGGKEPGVGQDSPDLSSLFSLLSEPNPGTKNPQAPPPAPTTSGTPLQSALNNMISILSNPFSQASSPSNQQKQPANIFGGNNNNNLFGGSGGTSSLFGGGSSIFGGGNRGNSLFGGNGGSSLFGGNGGSLFRGSNSNPLFGGGGSLFGGNSLFNLSPGASATRTTIVQKPSTTPSPTLSDNELLAQLIQLGISEDEQQRKVPSLKGSPTQASGSDIQSILSGTWGAGGKGSKASQPQPSETMQLLNILFENQNQQNAPPAQAQPSGPYWWLDMNAFMGGTPSSDPMAGIRPKLGQREYFLKVRK